MLNAGWCHRANQLWDAWAQLNAQCKTHRVGQRPPLEKMNSIGKVWSTKELEIYTPHVIVSALMRVYHQHAKFSNLDGERTVASLSNQLAGWAYAVRAGEDDKTQASEVEVIWESAVDYAIGVMRSMTGDVVFHTPQALEILRLEIGNIDPMVRCVLSNNDPQVLAVFCDAALHLVTKIPGLATYLQTVIKADLNPVFEASAEKARKEIECRQH